MDQDAFRSLLTKPREGESSSSSTRARGGLSRSSQRGYTSSKSRTKEIYTTKDVKPTEAKPMFAPRAQHKKQQFDQKYKDRAELRRTGADNEYKDVEKLLHDFERRKEDAGDDVEKLAQIEKERAYLGGDAEHSVLVKGLDFGLLAARKAELEREKAGQVDDELDELARDMGKGVGGGAGASDKPKQQGLSSKFKSIGQKDARPAGDKKKKKKKKALLKESGASDADAATEKAAPQPDKKQKTPPPEAPRRAPAPDPEDEDDIFADAGDYDLNAGDDISNDGSGDSDKEPGEMDIDDTPGPARGRSTSPERHSTRRDYSPDRRRRRSWSDSRSPSVDRGRSRYENDRYEEERRSDRRSDRRGRASSRSYSPSRSRSRSRDAYRDYDRYDRDKRDSRNVDYRGDYRNQQDRQRHNRYLSRSPSPQPGGRHRQDRHDRSGGSNRRGMSDRMIRDDRRGDSRRQVSTRHDRDWNSGRYGRGPAESRSRSSSRSLSRSRSRSKRSSRSWSRSASPPRRVHAGDGSSSNMRAVRRSRSRSRSPTPLLQQTLPFERSPTPESDEDDGLGVVTKLQPLASSRMSDVRGFLDADESAAKDAERRLGKARWRAQQGLATQEGVDPSSLKREMGEKQKANRDYVLLMNKLKKGGDEGGAAGGDIAED